MNESTPLPTQRITITDIDMPFGRMVAFMVKWSFAAIPALLIMWAVAATVFFIIAIFFGGMSALLHH
jgi:hypothetical protein